MESKCNQSNSDQNESLRWTQVVEDRTFCDSCAYGHRSRSLMLNENEFIVSVKADTFLKYTADLDCWTHCCKLPQIFQLQGRTMAVDERSNRLFMTGVDSEIVVVDLTDGSILYQSYGYRPHFGGCAGLVNVNGNIHRVGGKGSKGHCIWEHEGLMLRKQEVSVASDFQDYSEIQSQRNFLIHVPSKNIILMIGAVDDYGNRVHLLCKEREPVKRLGIWRFHIGSDRWVHVESEGIEFDWSHCECILTSNEEHVIIFKDEHRPYWKIAKRSPVKLLDIRDNDHYILSECSLQPTTRWSKLVAITGGKSDIIVTGWMRCLLAKEQSDGIQMPPKVILGVIAMHYSIEVLHWMTSDQHQVIPVSVILDSKIKSS